MTIKEKLKGFPKIHALVLAGEEGQGRKNRFIKKVKDLELSYKICEVERYPDCNTIIEGNITPHFKYFYPNKDNTTSAVTANHIRMIRDWITNSNPKEKWGLFCEGDISFETLKYWTFNWEQFKEKIPKDTKVLQMCLISNNLSYDLGFIKRNHTHWGANMYLVERGYAQRIIKRNCNLDNENIFNLSINERKLGSYSPCLPEDILFTDYMFDGDKKLYISGMYVYPLFIEDLKEKSYFNRNDNEKISHNYTFQLWESHYNNPSPLQKTLALRIIS